MKTPDLHVEEMRAGERALAPAEAPRVDARASDDARVLADDPHFLVGVRARAATGKRTRALAWSAPAFAFVAAVVLVVVVQRPALRDARVPDILAKGGASLVVERIERNGALQALADGDVAGAGDTVRLTILSGGARTAVLVSLDDRGVVSTHYDGRSPPLTASMALPDAFELDDAPGFERFILVVGAHADVLDIDVDAVIAAARALPAGDRATAPLPLPSTLTQVSFTLEKRGPT